MKIEQIQCPACGAELEIPEGRNDFFCQYCGSSVHINDEVERKEIVHRTVDEAEIVKSNNEIEMKKLEMEQQERHRKTVRKILIGSVIAYAILMLFLYFTGSLS